MNKIPAILTAAVIAGAAAVGAVTARRLPAVFGAPEPEQLPDSTLRKQSRTLQWHLERHPRDAFAAEMLQDIDLELIRRHAA